MKQSTKSSECAIDIHGRATAKCGRTEKRAAAARREPPAHPSRNRIIPVAIVIALAAGAYLVWRAFFATPKLPESIVALSGRIEGDYSAIAPKARGRILEIRFREGDSVKAGDTIAVL